MLKCLDSLSVFRFLRVVSFWLPEAAFYNFGSQMVAKKPALAQHLQSQRPGQPNETRLQLKSCVHCNSEDEQSTIHRPQLSMIHSPKKAGYISSFSIFREDMRLVLFISGKSFQAIAHLFQRNNSTSHSCSAKQT